MKKNTSFIAEFIVFLIILCFFVIPPFFSPKISQEISPFLKWNFPFSQMTRAFFAAVIFYFYKEEKTQALFFRFPFIFTFSVLFFIQLVFKFVSASSGIPSQTAQVVMPSGVLEWIFCILNFLFSAFFEEVLYRLYLPGRLRFFAGFLPKKKFFCVIFEVAACVIFAFSHFYMGMLSVLNAFFAHIVLRLCYFASKNIFCGMTAHFCYNVISLILL